MLSDFKMTSESKAKRLPKYEFGNLGGHEHLHTLQVS